MPEEIYYVEDNNAPVPTGQELTFQTDTREEYFQHLRDLGIPIYDPKKLLTSLYGGLANKKPLPPSTPPPPAPQKTASAPTPVENLPALPIVEDSPELQGAPDVETEATVGVQQSEGAIEPDRASEYFWNSDGPPVPRSAEETVGRVFPAPPNDVDFEAFVKRILRNEPAPGQPHPSHAAPKTRAPAVKADPIDLFSGAFTVDIVDLIVPTAHIPIVMSRSYRSGRPYYGPFGFGWDHPYNVYIRALGDGGFALWTGQLSEQHFQPKNGGFEPLPGFAARMERIMDVVEAYAVHFPEGRVWHFERPPGWSDTERIPLTKILDRYGNAVLLSYGTIDRVVSVLDTSGRGLLFQYGTCQLLERVTDHTGTRAIIYFHDTEIEHLVRVLLPPTNQYPLGIPITYVYDSYAVHPAMQHNILRILDAEDRLVVENDYAGPDAGWEFNTVIRQRSGAFEYQLEYQQIQYVWPDLLNIDALASRTLVRPPDGSLHTYTFNYRGDLLDHRYRLIRDGSLRVIAYRWQHDEEGNVTEAVGPDGLRKVFLYDSGNADPCARRNLLRVELAAAFSGIVPSRVLYEGIYEPRFQLLTQTKDESGAVTRFFYDFDGSPVGTGRLTRIELAPVLAPDGTTQQSKWLFEHNRKGQLTAWVRPEGGRTELKYIAGGFQDGFLGQIREGMPTIDLISTFGYDAAGFTAHITGPGGRKISLTNNALGQMERIDGPLADGQTAAIHRWLDDSGAIVKLGRPAGSALTSVITGDFVIDEYQRDETGYIHQVTLASNTDQPRRSLQRVDHEGRPLSIWDAAGTRIDRCFSENGVLLRETVAAGDSEAQTTKYTYDRAGRITRVTGPLLNETNFHYDIWGRAEKITLPNGAVKTVAYGANDLLLEEKIEEKLLPGESAPALLSRQTYEYDIRGRLITTELFSFSGNPSAAVPLKTRFFYDRDDNMRKIVLPRGAQVQYGFDELDRPTQTTDVSGNIRQLVYDAAGDIGEIKLTMVENGVTQTTTRVNKFDGRGRLTTSKYLTSVTSFEYDDRDLPIVQTGSSGVRTTMQYDVHNQVIEKLVDPGGLSLLSQFAYDMVGNLSRYTDPMAQATIWDRDRIGCIRKVDLPDGTSWKYNTNIGDRTVEQLMPSGNTVLLQYSQQTTSPVKMSGTPGPGTKIVQPHQFVYDGLGRLVSAAVGTESILRRYDSLGRLVEETARGKTVSMEFDDSAGTADLIFPDGRRERTAYNLAGQPTKITLMTPGTLGGAAGDLLLEIVYSTAGRPVSMHYGNGVEGQLVYDDQGRIIRLEYQKGGIILDSCRLRYDGRGHRAVVQYIDAATRNLVHRLDNHDRLVEARQGFPLAPLPDVTDSVAQVADSSAALIAAAGAPGISFSLDKADTRSKVTGLNVGAASETYVSTNDHRITAVGTNTISYDANGHRLSDSRFKYELDALNRVRTIRDRTTNAIIVELEYDALSRQVTGTTNGLAFERWFAGPTRIQEIAGGAPGGVQQISPYPLWPVPLCVVDAGGPAFIHLDEGLSTMSVTDAGGGILERHRFDVFGARTSFAGDGVTPLTSPKTEPNWRGMPALGATTLFSTPNRLYDPDTGVFISRDPMLYLDSPSPFAYAAHNPVDFADPSGLAKSAIPASERVQWVKDDVMVIHEEEVHFYEGQNTPPPAPDHRYGWYPLKDADKSLTRHYPEAWKAIKSMFDIGPLHDIATVAGMVEEILPYNAPDHFLAAGSHAKRWIWFSQRGQTGAGLLELLEGHFEAGSAVGSAEMGAAVAKGGVVFFTAAAKNSAKLANVAASKPKVYSVALEVKLKPGEVPSWVSDSGRRERHRNIGQNDVAVLLEGWSKSLNPEERKLGIEMKKLLKNSEQWHLHHDPQNAGVLQLVPVIQHQSPALQDVLHPLVGKLSNGTTGRVGGFFIWGVEY